MLACERQAIIIEQLREKRVVKIADLANRFGVATLTVRRDLDVLQDQKIVRRIYGGAVLVVEPEELSPNTFLAAEDGPENVAYRSKQAIAKAAAALVQEGETLMMGTGTTIYEVAKHLRRFSNLTIITGNLSIINELSDTGNTIYILGGVLEPNEYYINCQGDYSMHRRFWADKCFISCDGVTAKHGITADYPPNTRSGHVAMEQADQTIVVCGSQKIGQHGKSMTCALNEVDILVTDDAVAEEYCDEIRKEGVRVIVVPVDEKETKE